MQGKRVREVAGFDAVAAAPWSSVELRGTEAWTLELAGRVPRAVVERVASVSVAEERLVQPTQGAAVQWSSEVVERGGRARRWCIAVGTCDFHVNH